jgi:hypothetical protein
LLWRYLLRFLLATAEIHVFNFFIVRLKRSEPYG